MHDLCEDKFHEGGYDKDIQRRAFRGSVTCCEQRWLLPVDTKTVRNAKNVVRPRRMVSPAGSNTLSKRRKTSEQRPQNPPNTLLSGRPKLDENRHRNENTFITSRAPAPSAPTDREPSPADSLPPRNHVDLPGRHSWAPAVAKAASGNRSQQGNSTIESAYLMSHQSWSVIVFRAIYFIYISLFYSSVRKPVRVRLCVPISADSI